MLPTDPALFSGSRHLRGRDSSDQHPGSESERRETQGRPLGSFIVLRETGSAIRSAHPAPRKFS